MKIIRSLDPQVVAAENIFLAMGFFDGVHIGHQAVIEQAVNTAQNEVGQAWALTFEQHPTTLLTPERTPSLIYSLDQRIHFLETCGLSGLILLKFDTAFANQEPSDFIATLHAAIPNLHTLFVGTNWRYGRNASGTVDSLTTDAKAFGTQVSSTPAIQSNSGTVSSTHIRHAISHGELSTAEELLGRPVSVSGTVIEGRKIGREIGFPTANIDTQKRVLPPSGVYIVNVSVLDEDYQGVMNIGTRPTFKADTPDTVVEIHLLRTPPTLYGRDLTATLGPKLRKEQKFVTKDALIAQIERDIDAARAYFLENQAIPSNAPNALS